MTFDMDAFKTEMPAEILALLGDAENPYSDFEQSEAVLRACLLYTSRCV